MTYYECYADETFLRFLGLSSKELAGGHSLGRSFVSRKLQRSQNSIGVIDEDPGAPRDSYLKYLFSLTPVYSNESLFVFHDRKLNNKIFVIRPDLEAFTIGLARKNGIDLANAKYELSMNKEHLHEMLMVRKNLVKRSKLSAFFADKADDQLIITFKKLIKN